jgi:hypothetical protein
MKSFNRVLNMGALALLLALEIASAQWSKKPYTE